MNLVGVIVNCHLKLFVFFLFYELMGVWQQVLVQICLVVNEVCVFNLLELFKVDAFLEIGDFFSLSDLAQFVVEQDGWDIEPQVEGGSVWLEIDFEVTPDFLVKAVQIEHKEMLDDLNAIPGCLCLFPLQNFANLRLHVIALGVLVPVIEVEYGLNGVLLDFASGHARVCVLLLRNLHVRDDEVKVLLTLEGTQANWVEVHAFIPHVFKDSILGQIVVVPQREFEEWLIVIIRMILQFVVKEAAEKLDVALLWVDRQSLLVLGSLLIVVVDCVGMSLEHTQENQEWAYHHSCAALSCLAMHNDDRLLRWDFLVDVNWIWIGTQPMVLFHPLEEQGRIHAKDVHLLKVRHIVIEEGEFADWKVADCVSCILVLELSTQVVDLDHDSVVLGQERQNILFAIAVQAFEAWGGKTTRDDTICYVSQV